MPESNNRDPEHSNAPTDLQNDHLASSNVELRAIASLVETLQPLDRDARIRVVNNAWSRMWNVPSVNWRTMLDRFDLLWSLWLRSIFIHLPWIICFVLMLGWFAMSPQGISLTEYPVEYPWIRYVYFGAVVAIGYLTLLMTHGLRVDVLRAAAGKPSNLMVFGLLYWIAAFVFVARFALTNDMGQWGHLLGTALTSVTAIVAAWYLSKPFKKFDDVTVKSIAYAVWLLLLPLVFLAIGAYVVAHHIEWVAGLGAFAVVGLGLILLAASIQSLFLALPWFTRAPILCLSILVGTALLIHGYQEPIFERHNPLLENVPKNITRMSGECGQLIDKAATAPDDQGSSGATPNPVFLISAEGGGIRAAYWTAVSLEQLSQSSPRPLLEQTALLSGVSGGSLGVATWLAAQELPTEARLECIREFLSGDFFTQLIAGVFFLDIPRLFVPKSVLDKNRGDFFEAYIARRWLALTGKTFFYQRIEDLRPSRSAAKIYFNTTDALSGQFVAFGNAPAPLPPGANEEQASRLNEVLREYLADLRVAQAVHMSARFPYLSPNPDVILPARDAAKVLFNRESVTDTNLTRVASLVDGGYFDNSGLGPALRLIEDQARSNDEAERSMPRAVIHIYNNQRRTCNTKPAQSGCARASDESLKSLKGFSSWGWLTRPIDAILAVKEQHSLQRLNELNVARINLAIAKPMLWALPMPESESNDLLEFIASLPLHGRDLTWSEVALGWTLSPGERKFIDLQARDIAKSSVPKP